MWLVLGLLACGGSEAPETAPEAAPEAAEEATEEAAMTPPENAALFGTLPEHMHKGEVPAAAMLDLGRMLYYDKRLSKNHDISCNSCHQLDNFGVDNEATSPGHKGARGDRNSPTSYNAAMHVAQFWDGRAADVEAQAKGPVLAAPEMAMPSEEAVVNVLKSIPGYNDAFATAFPDAEDAITYDNMASAIGAFERGLVTPGPFDAFLEGDVEALNAEQQAGYSLFVSTGCTTCHMGPAVGGGIYQKLGLVHAYETEDMGRFKLTDNEADKFMFKVPSLRNITETGPYFHDGSIESLDEAVRLMAYHQLGKELDEGQVKQIVSFLGSLKGEVPTEYVAMPTLPDSGPDTPAPDPT